MLVARALKIGKIAANGMPPTYETMTLDQPMLKFCAAGFAARCADGSSGVYK